MADEHSGAPPTVHFRGQATPNSWPGHHLKLGFFHKWTDPDPRNSAPRSGAPGMYRVACALQRPSHPELPENHFTSIDAQRGSSYIRVIQHDRRDQADQFALRIQIQSGAESLEFAGLLNPEGFLGRLIAHRVRAESFRHAEQRVRNAIASWLSHVSLLLDVPLQVATMHITELATGNQMIDAAAPMLDVAPDVIGPMPDSKELAFYASLYREALNSNSPIYQFLCLFKIIEGVQKRRERLDRDIVARGGTPTRLRERLPSDPLSAAAWLNELFYAREWDCNVVNMVFPHEILGKRMNAVLETHLRPLRNHVAHAVLDSGEMTLSTDEAFQVADVDRWLPITKCYARYFLKRDFPEHFNPKLTVQSNLEILPVAELEPHDDVYESPAISTILLESYSEQKKREP